MRNRRQSAIQCIKNIHNCYKCYSEASSSVSKKSLQDTSNSETICLDDEIENVIEEIPGLISESDIQKPDRKNFSIENAALLWRAKNQNSSSGLSLLEWNFKKHFSYFNELSQLPYWADKILLDIDNELEIFHYLKEAFFPTRDFLVEVSEKKKEILGSLGKISILKDENKLIHDVLLPCDSMPVPNPVVDQHGIFINSGSYIKKMCWAPVNPELFTDQYLAVSVYKAPTERSNFYESGISPNQIIQIYNCGPLTMKTKTATRAQLEMILTHDWGKITDMSWSPQPLRAVARSENQLIGHLALCCTDGFIRIVPISKPSVTNCLLKLDKNHPVICLGAVRNKQNKEVFPTTMHWRQEFPDRIVSGYNTGHVGIFVLEACVFSSVARIIGVNIYLKPSIFHRVFHSPFRSIQISPFNWQLISCSSMTMNSAVVVDLGQPSDLILPSPIDLEGTIGSKILWPIPGDVIVLATGKQLYNKRGVLLCSAQKPAKRSRRSPLSNVSSIDLCQSLNILPIGTRSGQLRLLSLNTNCVNRMLKYSSDGTKISSHDVLASKFYLQYRLVEIDSNENQKLPIKSENGNPIISSSYSCCSCPPKLQCVHKLSQNFSICVSKVPIDDVNNWQLDSMLNINEIATNPNPRCSTWIAVSLECGVIHVVPMTHFYRSELDQISTGSCSHDLNESANQLKDEILLPKHIFYMTRYGRPCKYPRDINYQQLYREKRVLQEIEKSIISELDSAPSEISNYSKNLSNPLCGLRDFSLRSKSTFITDYFVNSSGIGLESFQCSTPKSQKPITKLSSPSLSKINKTSKSKSANISHQRNLRSNSKLPQIQNHSSNVPFNDANMSLVVSTRQRLRSFTGFKVDNNSLVKENEFIESRSPSFETADFGSSSLEKDTDPNRKLLSFQKPLNDTLDKKLITEISDLGNKPIRNRTRSFDQSDKFMINHSKSPGKSNIDMEKPVETSISIDSRKKRNKSISFESSELNISIDNKSVRQRLRSFDRPDIYLVTRSDLNSFMENKSIVESVGKKLSFDQSDKCSEKSIINNEQTLKITVDIDPKPKRNKSISYGSSELNIFKDKKSIDSIRKRTRSYSISENVVNKSTKATGCIDLEIRGNKSISSKSSNLNKTIDNKSIVHPMRNRTRTFNQSEKSNIDNENPMETSIDIDRKPMENKSMHKSSKLTKTIENKSIVEPMRQRTRSFNQFDNITAEKSNNNTGKPVKTTISVDPNKKTNKSTSCEGSTNNNSIEKPMRERLRSFDNPDIYDVPPSISAVTSKAYCEEPVKLPANNKSSQKRKKFISDEQSTEPLRKRLRSSDKSISGIENPSVPTENSNLHDEKIEHHLRNRSYSFNSDNKLNMNPLVVLENLNHMGKRSPTKKKTNKRKIDNMNESLTNKEITTSKPVKILKINEINKKESNLNSELSKKPKSSKIDKRSSQLEQDKEKASTKGKIKIGESIEEIIETIGNESNLNSESKETPKSSKIDKESSQLQRKEKIRKKVRKNEISEIKQDIKDKTEETDMKSTTKEVKEYDSSKKSINIENHVVKNDFGRVGIEIKEPNARKSNGEHPQIIRKTIISNETAASHIKTNENPSFKKSVDFIPVRRFLNTDIDEEDESDRVLINLSSKSALVSNNNQNRSTKQNNINSTQDKRNKSENFDFFESLIAFQSTPKVVETNVKSKKVNKTKTSSKNYESPIAISEANEKLEINKIVEKINKNKISFVNAEDPIANSDVNKSPEKINKNKNSRLSSSELLSTSLSTPQVLEFNEKSEKINKNKISFVNVEDPIANSDVNKSPEKINKNKNSRLSSSELLSTSLSTSQVLESNEKSEKINRKKISPRNDKNSNEISEKIDRNKISRLNSLEPPSTSHSIPKVSKANGKFGKITNNSTKKSIDDLKTELKKSKLQKENDERLQKLQDIMNTKRLALLNSQSTGNDKPATVALVTTQPVTSVAKSRCLSVVDNSNKLNGSANLLDKVDDVNLKMNSPGSTKKKSIINASCEDRMDKIKQVINRGLSQSNSDSMMINNNNNNNNDINNNYSIHDFPELLQAFRPLKAAKSANTSLSNNS